MTSVSQALPGFASAHTQSRQHAGGRDEDSNFGDVLRGAEKPTQPQGKHAAEPVADDAHPAKRAFAEGKAQPDRDADGKSVSQKVAGKNAKGNSDADRGTLVADADTAAQPSDAAPFQDRLPLLMALSDIRHFTASPNSDGDESAAEGDAELHASTGRSAAADQSARPGKHMQLDDASTSDPSRRTGRATVTSKTSGPDFGQEPASAGSVAEGLGHKDDILAQAWGSQTETDAALPQAWRPTSVAKAAGANQSAASGDPAKPSSSNTRMDVVSQQSFPAPPQNPISQTTSTLIDAIASDKGVQQAFSSASIASQTAHSVAVPTHVLKIELHPAELGMVTASLRLSGEQLSIEMKPETHEAYRRLTTDSDAIVKSLRGLGFDVDHVTILQPSIAVHSAGRTDATGSLPMSTGRDQSSSQPGNSGGNGAGDGRQPGRNDDNGAQEFGRSKSPPRDRAGDDMYI